MAGAPTIFESGSAKTGAGSCGACEQAASKPPHANTTATRKTPNRLDLPACMLAPWSLGFDRFVDLPPAAT
jgi:hypothetical protein